MRKSKECVIVQLVELIRDFVTVFVTFKLDKDPIKNESASLGTTFSPL